MTPWELLQERVRRDGASPLITMYDDATGERVELSAVTLANWVAKTANLFVEELDVEPGDVVSVELPAHWQSYVVGIALSAAAAVPTQPGAGLAAGAVVPATASDGPRVRVIAEGLGVETPNTLVLSLRPMAGGRLTDGPGIDYATEVRLFGDVHPGGESSGAALVDAAAALATSLPAGARVLTASPAYDLVGSLLAPLRVGGSLVLVRNEDAATRERRIATERVTHVLAGGAYAPV